MENVRKATVNTNVEFEAPAYITRTWIEKDEETGNETRKIEMLASGVQMDRYGDRMSESAIKDMKKGMVGKDLLPDHFSDWDEVIGTIIKTDIDANHNLIATAVLKGFNETTEKVVDNLVKAVDAGQRIGVSIAGWIKKVFFEEDDGGREVRVIDGIESDHIAITRSPAYPPAEITALKSFVFKGLDKAGITNDFLNRQVLEDKTIPVTVVMEPDTPKEAPVENPNSATIENPSPTTKEIPEMEEAKLTELLERLNGVQKDAIAGAVKDAVKEGMEPVADALSLANQGLAAILEGQKVAAAPVPVEEPVVEAVEEPAANGDFDKLTEVVTRAVEGIGVLNSRIQAIEDEPQRIGRATEGAQDDDGHPKDVVSMIVAKTQTDEFKDLMKRNPMKALILFASAFEDSHGMNHMIPIMRAQGVESPVAAGGNPYGWAAKAS